jgi:hypothetical protein
MLLRLEDRAIMPDSKDIPVPLFLLNHKRLKLIVNNDSNSEQFRNVEVLERYISYC